MSRRISCIVNPAAGNGRLGATVRAIQNSFQSKGVKVDMHETKSTSHASELTRKLATEHDVIAAVGGDGTVNHVAAGLIGSNSALAVFPIGSGNDFASLLGIPRNVDAACEIVLRGTMRTIDAGKVTLPRNQASTIFVNTLGLGFDASVAYEAQSVPLLKGVPLYLAALAKTLVSFQTVQFDVVGGEGQKVNQECFLACIGNGDREGGGFRITPDASPWDGLLDVCVISKVPILRVALIVRAVLSGKHKALADIHYFKSRSVRVKCALPMKLHTDGEVWKDSVDEIETKVMPGCLKVVLGTL